MHCQREDNIQSSSPTQQNPAVRLCPKPETARPSHMLQMSYTSHLVGIVCFSDCKEKTASRKARDPEAAKKLWDLSVKMVGLGGWNPFTADDRTPPS
jgi:hypothetical protein